MSNPANLVAGLLDERESAERNGDAQLLKQIDAEIDAQRDALETFDPIGVDEETQRKFVAGVRRRLEAFDRGERLDEGAQAEPRVHNPANYLTGLLDERDGALRAGRPTDDIDAEIEKVRPHFDSFQPEEDEAGDARAHYAAAKRRLADLPRRGRGREAQPEQVEDPGEGESKDAKKTGARTTKAAAPPRTAAQ
jgi:hypothetical protein